MFGIGLLKKTSDISLVREAFDEKEPKFTVAYLSQEYLSEALFPEDYESGAVCISFEKLHKVLLLNSELIFTGSDKTILGHWAMKGDKHFNWTKIFKKDVLFSRTEDISVKIPKSKGIEVILIGGKSFIYYPNGGVPIDLKTDEINTAISEYKRSKKK
ncbi:MAG: hypothetical protein KAI57_04820 [Candidatus Pacebacteria bacterium]|nr:hypothetical protein [Candidatus Paceibacterota bacterium]